MKRRLRAATLPEEVEVGKRRVAEEEEEGAENDNREHEDVEKDWEVSTRRECGAEDGDDDITRPFNVKVSLYDLKSSSTI